MNPQRYYGCVCWARCPLYRSSHTLIRRLDPPLFQSHAFLVADGAPVASAPFIPKLAAPPSSSLVDGANPNWEMVIEATSLT